MQIYDDLKAYANLKGLRYILGNEYFQSLQGNRIQLNENEKLLIIDVNVKALINNYNKIEGYVYNGAIGLGRKFETLSYSSVKENFEDKLNNRLKELSVELQNLIIDFACLYDYKIDSLNVALQLNKFAQNIDFVVAELQLSTR